MTTTPSICYASQIVFHGDTTPSFTDFHSTPKCIEASGYERIFEVVVREPRADEEPGYWSWWDEREQRFEFTWRHEGLLEMCFPYGTKAEEGRGRGKKARTVVELVREIRREEVSEITMRICEERRKS